MSGPESKRRRRGRSLARCPKSIQPLFLRVYDAVGIGPSRAAILMLAYELTRRGQSRSAVEDTLRVMRPDLGLSIITPLTIARVAHAKGGFPGVGRIRGCYTPAQIARWIGRARK